jgi:hypothetical protein
LSPDAFLTPEPFGSFAHRISRSTNQRQIGPSRYRLALSYLGDLMNPSSSQQVTTDHVRLVTDASSMRQQLRFAFANHYTVVQELMQNARRAGATCIRVDFDEASSTLVVCDDGSGIEDFQTLLIFAGTGWNEEVVAAERPYGMGFMSAIYAATHVQIESLGRCLAFDSERLLADDVFRLEPLENPIAGTKIVLTGVKLDTPAMTMRSIAKGYPIPVLFNSELLHRTDSVDQEGFLPCDVGHVRIANGYDKGSFRVYLQGFKVYESAWYCEDIVHLDGALFRGKFPDRDRVIDEATMLELVEAAVKTLYENKLSQMKSALPPHTFCREALRLAQSLDRLDIFNDIDLVPSEWLGTLTELPHSTLDGEELCVESHDGVFTRSDLQSSGYLISDVWFRGGFESFDSCEPDDDGSAQRLWIMTYASRSLLTLVDLHEDHWLLTLPRLEAGSLVNVDYRILSTGQVQHQRTHWIGGTAIELCEVPTLTCGGKSAHMHEPFAFIIGGTTTIIVPCTKGGDHKLSPTYVTRDCLRQCHSYIGDLEQLDDAALEADEREVNQAVRLLLAKTPVEQLEHLLREALRNYSGELKMYASMALTVDERGCVSVQELSQACPA